MNSYSSEKTTHSIRTATGRIPVLITAVAAAGGVLYCIQVFLHLSLLHTGLAIDPTFSEREFLTNLFVNIITSLILLPLVFASSSIHLRFLPKDRSRFFVYLSHTFWWGSSIGGIALLNDMILRNHPSTSPVSLTATGLLLIACFALTIPIAHLGLKRKAALSIFTAWFITAGLGVGWTAVRYIRSGSVTMVKSTSSPVSPDLLVITIDTLRRDRLGCYGSDLGATTTFDSLAASGALFTDAFCQIPITLPAHTTIFTGVPPATHGIYENGSRRLAPSFPTLAGICSEHGYKTAAFVSAAPLEARYGLDKGFEIYNDDLRLPNREGWRTRIAYFSYKRILILKIYIEKFFSWSGPIAEIPGTETVDKAVKWLDSTDGAIFLWVHLYDPHIPYTPPESLREKFPAKEYEKRLIRNEIASGTLRGQDFELIDTPFDPGLYNAEVAASDLAIRRLLTAWRKRPGSGKRDDLVILLADHGEHLGEHSYFGHSSLLFNQSVRIPLMISGSDIEPGTTINIPAQQIDILPTIREFMGLPEDPRLPGRSFASILTGYRQTAEYDMDKENKAVFMETHSFGTGKLAAIYLDGWKLICTWPDLKTDNKDTGLFNIVSDPGETEDMSGREPERLETMKNIIISMKSNFTSENAASLPVETDESARERLRSLGYIQ